MFMSGHGQYRLNVPGMPPGIQQAPGVSGGIQGGQNMGQLVPQFGNIDP